MALSPKRRTDTPSDRPAAPKRINRNSKLFKTILSAIQEKKGEDIVSLDLRQIPEAVADFFFICDARSGPQIRAISEHIEDQVKEKCGEIPYHREGNQKQQWVLIDYVNIVVHVMLPENRTFYQLEEMWSDAEQVKHD
ncbi:MAG: ribosome silencing factor [Bacteroidota bacterium]